jgi:hypothetical protein
MHMRQHAMHMRQHAMRMRIAQVFFFEFFEWHAPANAHVHGHVTEKNSKKKILTHLPPDFRKVVEELSRPPLVTVPWHVQASLIQFWNVSALYALSH